MQTNLENTTTINENSRYDANTQSKDDNGNHSNHQMKIPEALDVAIHYPPLHSCVSVRVCMHVCIRVVCVWGWLGVCIVYFRVISYSVGTLCIIMSFHLAPHNICIFTCSAFQPLQVSRNH